MTVLSPAATDWVIDGEHGISSNAIFHYLLLGRVEGRWFSDYPHDPDDFRRCQRVLRAVPELREAFPRMAECGPVWAALVARWDEIDAAIEAAAPGYIDARSGWAHGAYKLMESIIDAAKFPATGLTAT